MKVFETHRTRPLNYPLCVKIENADELMLLLEELEDIDDLGTLPLTLGTMYCKLRELWQHNGVL